MTTHTSINDGGPAFPHDDSMSAATRPGMTLRDYFAAKAIQGICASNPTDNFTDAMIAREAYNIADAMIKVRSA